MERGLRLKRARLAVDHASVRSPGLFSSIAGSARNIIDRGKKAVEWLMNQIKRTVTSVTTTADENKERVQDTIKVSTEKKESKSKGLFNRMVDAVKRGLETLGKGAVGAGKTVTDIVGNGVKGIVELSERVLGGIGDALHTVFKALIDVLYELFKFTAEGTLDLMIEFQKAMKRRAPEIQKELAG